MESESNMQYEHPLVSRYASKEMSFIWSPMKKFSTWRKLWLVLAESEKELGLDINEEQLEEMREHLTDIDFNLADKYEAEFRHDGRNDHYFHKKYIGVVILCPIIYSYGSCAHIWYCMPKGKAYHSPWSYKLLRR